MTSPYNRRHWNWNGSQKRAYVEDVAKEIARVLTDKFIEHPTGFSSYRCHICKSWHVGRNKWLTNVYWQDKAVWCELGPRAYWNLYWENTGPSKRKMLNIANRGRKLVARS